MLEKKFTPDELIAEISQLRANVDQARAVAIDPITANIGYDPIDNEEGRVTSLVFGSLAQQAREAHLIAEIALAHNEALIEDMFQNTGLLK